MLATDTGLRAYAPTNLFYLFIYSDTIKIIVGCIAFIILYMRLVIYVRHQFFVLYGGGGGILLICIILNIQF